MGEDDKRLMCSPSPKSGENCCECFSIPALRKVREERGAPLTGDATKI